MSEVEAARLAERQAIVEWLRHQAAWRRSGSVQDRPGYAAAALEVVAQFIAMGAHVESKESPSV